MTMQPDSPRQQPLPATPAPRPMQPRREQREIAPPHFSRGLAKGLAMAVTTVLLIAALLVTYGIVKAPRPDFFTAATSPSSEQDLAGRTEEGLGRIGLTDKPLTAENKALLALPTNRTEGLVIVKVWPNTAAEKAGLLVNDIIFAVDGIPLGNTSGHAFVTKIEYTPIGEKLTLLVERAGVTMAIPVRVEHWCTHEIKLSDRCSAN